MNLIIYILPELFLSVSIIIFLMIGIFVKKSFKLVNLLVVISLIFTTALILNQPDEAIKIFNKSYIIDEFSNWFLIETFASKSKRLLNSIFV